jgi:hypothetical protein
MQMADDFSNDGQIARFGTDNGGRLYWDGRPITAKVSRVGWLRRLRWRLFGMPDDEVIHFLQDDVQP